MPRADLSCVRSAAESLVGHLRPGNLVVLESTVPPRTTEELLIPVLRASGLPIAGDRRHYDAGRENGQHETLGRILVAYCPERVLPGRILAELVHNDRVIGGVDRASAERTRSLYAAFVEGEILLTDVATAEVVKLMENTFRDVNVALANEFSLVAERVGVDVWEAIELANHHPRVNILRPGPGVGGHCIAVDPYFLAQAAPEVTPLIQAARRVNREMPAHVVDLVKRAVAGVERPVIACLGLAYKANVADTRESPALEVVRLLRREGYDLRACDPHISALPGLEIPLTSLEESLRGADCAVILTDHREFLALSRGALRSMRHPIVVDTRNVLGGKRAKRVGDRLQKLDAPQAPAAQAARMSDSHRI